ncbi:MAG: hypothetical protein ACOX67_01210 [Oscillospiraceae bacterium]|jgi:hypothetical protein
MKTMERLIGVVAAGFLLLFGAALTFGALHGPLGPLSLIAGGAVMIASLVILLREAALYIDDLIPPDPPEEAAGSDSVQKEEDGRHGTTD